MKSFRKLLVLPVMSLLCITLVGCGNSNVVSVAGTVTYKGKPAANCLIHFVPEKGRPSDGVTDAQGQFTLVYAPEIKGAERGKHKVSLEPLPGAAANNPKALPGQTAPVDTDTKAMLDKYGPATSKHTVEISGAVSDLKINLD